MKDPNYIIRKSGNSKPNEFLKVNDDGTWMFVITKSLATSFTSKALANGWSAKMQSLYLSFKFTMVEL